MDQPAFRVLAETTPAAIFVQRDGRLLYVNAAAEAISGYSRAELLSLDVWQLLPPEVRELARAVYAARLRGEPVSVPPRREQRLIVKNGETRWMDVSIGRIEWGGAPALLGTAFDVSDRRRAEAARRRDERRYRALIEHASDAVLVFDATRLVTYVGPSIERILGHPPSALEGHDLYELIHPDDLELCRSAVETLLASPRNTVRIQYRVRHADGRWRWMEGIGTNLMDEPAIGGIVVNARDVTDWRAAEDQLSESEARFALAIDGAKDGIWDWDMASETFFVSPRMREMLGIAPDDPISVPDLFGGRVHPDDQTRVWEGWLAHLGDGSTHYEAEYRYRGPDGTYRWILVRARTVRDGERRAAAHDRLAHRHDRAQGGRGGGAPAPGGAGARAPRRRDQRDGGEHGPRAQPAAGGHRELRARLHPPAGAERDRGGRDGGARPHRHRGPAGRRGRAFAQTRRAQGAAARIAHRPRRCWCARPSSSCARMRPTTASAFASRPRTTSRP